MRRLELSDTGTKTAITVDDEIVAERIKIDDHDAMVICVSDIQNIIISDRHPSREIKLR